jgi:hypothetical protein
MADSLMIMRDVVKLLEDSANIWLICRRFFSKTGPCARPCRIIHRPVVDAIDRAMLELLAEDARITNQRLAERVGVAPSTALPGCARCASAA